MEQRSILEFYQHKDVSTESLHERREEVCLSGHGKFVDLFAGIFMVIT